MNYYDAPQQEFTACATDDYIVQRYIRQKPCFLRTSITFTTVPYGASIVAFIMHDSLAKSGLCASSPNSESIPASR